MGCDLRRTDGQKALHISIHAPTWGATGQEAALKQQVVFQSTHPRGVRPNTTALYGSKVPFQSTHPRGVRRRGKISSLCNPKFQSTHPRGVRLQNATPSVNPTGISIHAPTWGATLPKRRLRSMTAISIHAPTWGATLLHKYLTIFGDISIHAPTWGATLWRRCLLRRGQDFNPRTHVGCDMTG